MTTNKLKLYYTYFIPITILQSISSLLLLLVFSVEDYGQITLYFTNINLLFFLTLGIQLGYTLVLDDDLKSTSFTTNLNFLTYCFSLALIGLTLVLNTFLHLDQLIMLSVISGCLMISFTTQKAIFQTNYQIHRLNLAILSFRLILFIDLLVYIISNDIMIVLSTDVLLRFIHTIIVNIQILKVYGIPKCSKLINYNSQYKRVLQLGFPIMIGNWITMLYLLADKFVLRNDLQNLGYYSFAITIVVLFRVLITPIKDLVFVSMANQNDLQSLKKNTYLAIIAGFALTILGSISMLIAFDLIGLFAKYQIARQAVLILLAILPISLSLDIFLFNYSRIKNGKLFLIKSLFCGGLMFSSLYLYNAHAVSFNINYFSLLVVFNYILIFVIFVYDAFDKQDFLKISSLLILLELVYIILILTSL